MNDAEESSSVASVLAAAETIVAEAQIDIAAEREALAVAEAAATAEKSVVDAAVIATWAASLARDRSAAAAAGAAQKLADSKGWMAAQNEMARLSTNSLPRIEPGATHAAFVDNPDHAAAVTRAIHDVVVSVRTGEPLKGP